ncbi:type IV pilin [Halorubrum aethiopicum]|uniref:type IV pilin n=1 Tax=Halorubrum aethiopicum TaxID=1758255 RepID=UPI001E4AE7F4|nr:type IV pilin N-terminal domain-containing protein [Halorubrum aethiopicum]
MSPVIGVILMVAITVILAAVIGTFVLGLGDTLGDNQPTTQLDVSIEGEDGDGDRDLVIEHGGGDPIDSGTLDIIVTDEDDNEVSTSGEFSERFSVGDVETGDFDVDDTGNGENLRIRIIHQPSESILVDRTIEVDGIDGVENDDITFN